MTDGWWKVGELARRTGLTVRTLHFYDEIGLLTPSARSDGGHRYYDAADVARLQRITSLRQLGLSLEEIADLLEGRETDPGAILRRHAARLREQSRSALALAGRLEDLAGRVERREGVPVEELLRTIEETVMYERYYTKEQLEELERRRQELGDEGMARAQQQWADLIARARAAMEAGTPPDDPEALAIAREWKGLIEAFTGGNPGIRQSLQRVWDENRDAMAQRTGVDPALGAWVGRAIERLG